MNEQTDVLFITHMEIPRDSGDPRAYAPLRYELAGQAATIPWLRALAAGATPETALRELAALRARAGFPPVLTPFYMRGCLQRAGFSFVDIPCLETAGEQVRAILAGGVRVVALSTTWLAAIGGADAVRRAAASIRTLAPGAVIVAGGVGVRKGLRARALFDEGWFGALPRAELARSYLLVDAEQDRGLDALVYSESGEATLAEIVRRVRAGRPFADVCNLAIPEGRDFRFTEAREEISEIDGAPVDWSLHADRLGGGEAPVRTALGCPFRCEFCDFFGLYQSKLRGIESLLAELRTVPVGPGGRRRVFFTDDNVAATRKRLVELTRAMIDAKLDVAWRSFLRADVVDDETADLLRASGCEECLIGIESGDPGILANMRKRLDPAQAIEAVERLDARGISTMCTFVIGFPGESAATLARTAALISAFPSGERARAMHRYYMFPFNVVPLCPVAGPERRAAYGLEGLGEHWRHNTMNAEEAVLALGEVFRQVRGPTHVYLEHRPPGWSVAATRRVMEQRDCLQKARLAGLPSDPAPLLDAVRQAEAGARNCP